MLTEALHRKMICACRTRIQFETVYSDMNLVYQTIERSSEWASRLKAIAKEEEDVDMVDCTLSTNNLALSTMRGETSISQFKERIWELERKHPEVFKRGRIDSGTPEGAIGSIVFRVVYRINRYDVRYPRFDMHKSNDRCGDLKNSNTRLGCESLVSGISSCVSKMCQKSTPGKGIVAVLTKVLVRMISIWLFSHNFLPFRCTCHTRSASLFTIFLFFYRNAMYCCMGTNARRFFGIFSIWVEAKMAIGLEGTNLLNDRYRRLLSKIFGKWGSFPTSLKVEFMHDKTEASAAKLRTCLQDNSETMVWDDDLKRLRNRAEEWDDI